MAWEEHRVVEIRERFVLRARSPKASMSAACREFGISRKTGYKWLRRFEEGGVEALQDRSRRPRLSKRIDGELVLRVLELQRRYGWGPKKLRTLLLREGSGGVPSARTIARILDRAGVRCRKRRVVRIRSAPVKPPSLVASAPNDVWTLDFKGWWRARNGERCEPLTVRDAFSRYVLCARIMSTHATDAIQREFERLFREFGVPKAMQFDNGEPFAALQARAGITRLSAFFVSLGITLLRSRPAKPQDNGAHERVHRDIREEVESRPASSRLTQQRALTEWRKRFNEVRPHEALAMKTPAQCYRPSVRAYVGPRPPRYPEGRLLRRVSSKGYIRLDGAAVFLGEGLVRRDIALEPIGDRYRAWFYEVDLGMLKTEPVVPPRSASGTSP